VKTKTKTAAAASFTSSMSMVPLLSVSMDSNTAWTPAICCVVIVNAVTSIISLRIDEKSWKLRIELTTSWFDLHAASAWCSADLSHPCWSASAAVSRLSGSGVKRCLIKSKHAALTWPKCCLGNPYVPTKIRSRISWSELPQKGGTPLTSM
jgi:hypothetical protein